MLGFLFLGILANILDGFTILLNGSKLVGHSSLNWLFVPLVAVYVILSPLFIYLVIRGQLKSAASSPASRYLKSAKALAEMVFHHKYRLTYVSWGITIESDYTLSTTLTLRVLAADQPLYAIRQMRSSSIRVDDLNKLEFRAKSPTKGTKVCVLPASDTNIKREFLIFLDPPIEVNETVPRELEIRSQWPASAGVLSSIGETDENLYRVPPFSEMSGPVPVSVSFSKALKGRFQVELACSDRRAVTPDPVSVDAGDATSLVIQGVSAGMDLVVRIKRLAH